MATEAEKKAAQEQRDAIEVANSKPEEKVEVKEEDKIEEEVVEETVEEKEEAIEAVEEEVDELKEEKAEAKTEKEKQRIQKRIDKLTADKAALKAENTRLQAALDAKPDNEKVLTEDDVETRAEKKAAAKVAEREFEAAVNRIADSAAKIDKAFKTKINALAEEMGSPIPGQMIGILDDLPNNGADVLLYLAKDDNTEEAEEIWALPPAKMALKLGRISDTLKKPPKPISKVPAPNDPLKGKGITPDVLNPKDMESFVRIRARQVEERRKSKMGMH